MHGMIVRLLPLDGGEPIDIEKDMSLVGRGEDCDVLLNHKSVSKQHCVIVKTDSVLVIRDLGSTNGTRVNGQRIRRGVLLPNDSISIANFHFRLLFLADTAPHANGNGFLGRTMVATNGDLAEGDEMVHLLSSEPPVRLNDLPDRYTG
jgi:predicted component of type VI protein secretion system